MIYAYDLDGTLVDSEPLIRKSYELAGATPPADFFGKPFQDWSRDWEMHKRKHTIYIDMIARRGITALPLAELARRTGGHVVTGASYEAVVEIGKRLNLQNLVYHVGLSTSDKARVLNNLGETGIMFEDLLPVAEKLKELTKWTILHVI